MAPLPLAVFAARLPACGENGGETVTVRPYSDAWFHSTQEAAIYAQARTLRATGTELAEIARALGICRKTVARYRPPVSFVPMTSHVPDN